MKWWITQSGVTQGPASDAGNPLVAGPYNTLAQAQAAYRAGVRPGGTSAPAAPASPASGSGTGCGWFMVPPDLWQQILHGVESVGHPSFEIAQATYACGARAQALISQGYQQYATKAEAQNAVSNANTQANATPTGLAAIGAFFTKIGQRGTWVRIVKVAVGAIMIIAGLVKIGAPGAEKLAGNLPKVIPV